MSGRQLHPGEDAAVRVIERRVIERVIAGLDEAILLTAGEDALVTDEDWGEMLLALYQARTWARRCIRMREP